MAAEKKVRKAYTAAFKLAAIEFAENEGGNRAAGKKFGIGEGCVRQWRKIKDLLENAKGSAKSFRGKAPKWTELEDKLEQTLKDKNLVNEFGEVDTFILKTESMKLVKEMSIIDYCGSNNWIRNFLRRKGFKLKRVRNSRKVSHSKELSTAEKICSIRQTCTITDEPAASGEFAQEHNMECLATNAEGLSKSCDRRNSKWTELENKFEKTLKDKLEEALQDKKLLDESGEVSTLALKEHNREGLPVIAEYSSKTCHKKGLKWTELKDKLGEALQDQKMVKKSGKVSKLVLKEKKLKGLPWIAEGSSKSCRRRGGRGPKWTGLEDKLEETLKDKKLVNESGEVSKLVLKEETMKLVKEMGITDYCGSKDWIRNFLQRKGLKLKRVHSSSQSKKSCTSNKIRNAYTAAFKLAAIESAENEGGNRAAAKKFGVEERRVRQWRKIKDLLLNAQGSSKSVCGAKDYISSISGACPKKTELDFRLEDKLEQTLKDKKLVNESGEVSKRTIKDERMKLVKEMGIADKGCSDIWISNFFIKYGLKQVHNPSEPRKSYTAEFKLKVIEFAEKKGNRAADREFNIPESNIRMWRTFKNVLETTDKTRCTFRGSKPGFMDLEDKLLKYVLEHGTNCCGLDTNQLRSQAIQFAEDLQIESYKASDHWIRNFLRRNQVISAKITRKGPGGISTNHSDFKIVLDKDLSGNDSRGVYPCGMCGEAFNHLFHFKQHMSYHVTRNNYLCFICGKTTTNIFY